MGESINCFLGNIKLTNFKICTSRGWNGQLNSCWLGRGGLSLEETKQSSNAGPNFLCILILQKLWIKCWNFYFCSPQLSNHEIKGTVLWELRWVLLYINWKLFSRADVDHHKIFIWLNGHHDPPYVRLSNSRWSG